MDELVQWLREQLDDDERTARAATDGPWTTMGQRVLDPSPPSNRLGIGMAVGHAAASADYNETAEHIARHDPERVLREIDAKRQLVARGGPFCTSDCDDPDNEPKNPDTDWTTPLDHHLDCAAYEAAKVLALPYADRPGYREEWRP
ncbi:DUF6221 family protein [Streptomyces sp. MPA0124]|uniref:DUF6221 family protein n=1 Tax=Streptomyces sp. MPA0124 TaxID=3378069 RepID=UPI003854FA2B